MQPFLRLRFFHESFLPPHATYNPAWLCAAAVMLGVLRGKPWVIGLASFLTLILFYVALSEKQYVPSFSSSVQKLRPTTGSWEFVTERDERNLGLTEEQCQVGHYTTHATP